MVTGYTFTPTHLDKSIERTAAVELSRNALEEAETAAATAVDDEFIFGTQAQESDSREKGSWSLSTPIWTAFASRM